MLLKDQVTSAALSRVNSPAYLLMSRMHSAADYAFYSLPKTLFNSCLRMNVHRLHFLKGKKYFNIFNPFFQKVIFFIAVAPFSKIMKPLFNLIYCILTVKLFLDL